jgi:hypothetical protein
MSINFPKAEEEVLGYWREFDAFQTQYFLRRKAAGYTVRASHDNGGGDGIVLRSSLRS